MAALKLITTALKAYLNCSDASKEIIRVVMESV